MAKILFRKDKEGTEGEKDIEKNTVPFITLPLKEIEKLWKISKKEEDSKGKKVEFISRKKGVIIPKAMPIDYNLTVLGKETHYKSIKNSLYTTHEPEFNILEVEASGSDYPFKIIDPYFLCNQGSQPICHKSMTPKQLEGYKKISHKKWDDKFNAHLLTMAIKNKRDYFKQANWKETINYLAYQGLDKDMTIVETLKSLAWPMPRSRRYQNLNTNALIFTQTKTTKTTTLTELGWEPLSGSTLTVSGLFGGGMKYKPGQAQGWGVLGIDECGKVNLMNDDTKGILEFCLEYLQKGVMQRIIHGMVPCKGTKTFCLFSNPRSSRNALMPYYVKNLLSRLGALSEQVSSRLGILVFGTHFKQVWQESVYHKKDLDKLRLLIKETWIEQQNKWMKLLNHYSPWLNELDEEYAKTLKNLPYNDDAIYRFVANGIGKFHNRTKCAALKLTVINNLDKFFLIKNVKDLHEELDEDIIRNWEFFKSVNTNSIKLISHVKMDREAFWDYCDSEKLYLLKNADLSRIFNIPWSTIQDWKIQYKEKYPEIKDIE